VRRLRSLIRGLPVDSALRRAANPTGWAWTTDTELLADLVELADTNLKMFLRANTEKGTLIPDPIHVPRPWERTDVQPQAEPPDPAKVQQFFAGRVVVDKPEQEKQ
jgi:hypothetical protein